MARWGGIVVLIIALVLGVGAIRSAQSNASVRDFSIPATPVGITLETVSGQTPIGGFMLEAPKVQTHLADATGMSLYVYDRDDVLGKSACQEDCASSWHALPAPAEAKPSGQWNVVTRSDGGRQWAYAGKPLYTFAGDAKLGERKGDGVDGIWHLAVFRSVAETIAPPAGLAVKSVNAAGGEVLVDNRGMIFYTFDGDTRLDVTACKGECLKSWTPVAAGELAKPVGDWSVITRIEGGKQWTYKGRPLYTYNGDLNPDDIIGRDVDKHWHPAIVQSYFLPTEVSIRNSQRGWPVLATADGMTLYARDHFRFSYGGFSVNDSPPPSADVGRSIGAEGCVDDCTKSWIPLLAQATAQASGFWTVVTRPDGARQWAYQGYPLYTYADDKKPGDMVSRNLFELTDGSHAMYWRVATP